VVIGLLVTAVVVIGGVNVGRRQPPEKDKMIAEGTVIDGDITLITSDRNDVGCSSDRMVERRRCGFNQDGTAQAGDERDRLQPFMTVDRHLYVIPGLFLDPAIKRRYESEPPQKPREQLKRFTAHCKLTVIGKMTDFKLRWVAAGPWSPPQKAEIATATDCKVDG
jgi:hypothetical protein